MTDNNSWLPGFLLKSHYVIFACAKDNELINNSLVIRNSPFVISRLSDLQRVSFELEAK
jgi:hypothetical protein